MNLSKTRYCKGARCPKILWLDEHKSEVRDESVQNQAVLDTGTKVGELARGYYGAYVKVPYNEDKSVMIAETERLLDAKIETICEASFSYNGNFCSVDILRVLDNGVEIVEVKSSTEIKPIYYDDMAFQYYVLVSCGLDVKKISIMLINNQYERHGEIDLHGLFSVYDCTEKVRAMQENVALNIERFKKNTAEKDEIAVDIGMQCVDLYECEYHAYCWRHIPKNSVFDISGLALRWEKKFAFYKSGIVTFEQLLESGRKFSDAILLQAETEVYNRPPAIDKKAIRAFLDTLSWPLYFLDFETFNEAIPPFDGLRPYMQTPFQYSLHIQKSPKALPEHLEFLANEDEDPRLNFVKCLCAAIPKDSCVVVYNMSFEKGRIKELALWLEGSDASSGGLADHLINIHGSIKDLMQPFQSHAYYSGSLAGSYSIKKVLPALCSGDPELDYNALDLVHNGEGAKTAYMELVNKTPEERKRIRSALLAYCRLDTLAMVKILEKLWDLCG